MDAAHLRDHRGMSPNDRALLLDLEIVATRKAAINLVLALADVLPDGRQELGMLADRLGTDETEPEVARLARLVTAALRG